MTPSAQMSDSSVDAGPVGPHLLGRHELGRAEERRRGRQVAPVRAAAGLHQLGDAEVEDLDARGAAHPRRQEQVPRLEVAVDDARLVRLAYRLARLDEIEHRVVDREGPALLDQGPQVRPLEVLHDDVGGPGREPPDVVDAGDVLALEARRGPRLAEKALDRLGLGERLRAHELDGPELPQLEVGGRHHDAHRPPAEHPLHAVLAGDHVPDADVLAAVVVRHGGAVHSIGICRRP